MLLQFIFASVLGLDLPIAFALQNGYGTIINEFPFLGSFNIPDMGKKAHRCNTILMSLNTAVTAGRCVIYETLLPEIKTLNFGHIEAYVKMGTSRIDGNTEDIRRISGARLHQKFAIDPKNIIGALYDIAVLTVVFPFNESPKVQVIPNLFELRKSGAKVPHEWRSGRGIIVSWGSTEAFPDVTDFTQTEEAVCLGPMPMDLQYFHVELIFNMRNCCEINLGQVSDIASTEEIEDCVDQLIHADSVNCFTTFFWNTKNTSTAWGDAGAPLLWQYKEHVWYVMGMFISGIPRHNHPFHVYYPGFFLPYERLFVKYQTSTATTIFELSLKLLGWFVIIIAEFLRT